MRNKMGLADEFLSEEQLEEKKLKMFSKKNFSVKEIVKNIAKFGGVKEEDKA